MYIYSGLGPWRLKWLIESLGRSRICYRIVCFCCRDDAPETNLGEWKSNFFAAVANYIYIWSDARARLGNKTNFASMSSRSSWHNFCGACVHGNFFAGDAGDRERDVAETSQKSLYNEPGGASGSARWTRWFARSEMLLISVQPLLGRIRSQIAFTEIHEWDQ